MAQVTVADGILEGELVDNVLGGQYYSFKGIPYAEPPIGYLRFKAPQPLKPWDGVRSAKDHGPICYQFNLMTRQISGSEDCLYLNVYTPKVKPPKPLPVMVYIHGGAFVCGSGNDDEYGPDFLVRHDVILVTINYRLEILGFLSLGTEDVPGNAGMKDQVAALRWVRKNISNFGGDAENVTIFGESAGAASVVYHLVSPMSKGLFKRAIAQSGSATNWWAQGFEPRERAAALARQLGFYSDNDKELYDFFKNQPKESLVNINAPISLAEAAKESNDLQFGVVSEKTIGDNECFFSGDVLDALRSGIHEGVDLLSGFCEQEGLIAFLGLSVDKLLAQANGFKEYFVPKEIALNCSIIDQLEVGRKIKKFYFENENVGMQNLDQIERFSSMKMFLYGIFVGHKILAKQNKNKLYLYKFTCKSDRNRLGHILGVGQIIGKETVVCHADDLPYLFNVKEIVKPVEKDSETYKMIENTVTLWTNFAKYGHPTPDRSLGVTWPAYTLPQQPYLDIGEELVAGIELEKEEMDFWEGIYKQYLPQYVA